MTLAGELTATRARTLELVAPISTEDLERVHSPLMSPLVWDLGHIAAFEDLWLAHRHGGLPLLRRDLATVYDAFETPRARRGELPYLRTAEARAYLEAVRARSLAVLERDGDQRKGQIAELVLRHEQQHGETMLQTIQLARLEGYEPPGRRAAAAPGVAPGRGGLELVEVAGGECTIGAEPDGFAYDNERPRHRVSLPGFRIGRTAVTNASYLTFVEGGGYERREWWSDEGWGWKEQHDIHRPAGWSQDLAAEWRLGRMVPLHPDRPVVHVSWFEADAFARAHGARLPTELEWEKAATWDQASATARRFPWGETEPVAGVHANLDHGSGGPDPAGAHPTGATPEGILGLIGDVWEWTASRFAGYPGFRADPYREYSEVFFGGEHRVLRGGSWATRAHAVTPCFRNWDFPTRRQIFAGFRLAADAG